MMQNYLTKENLGLPTSIACMIAVLAGYGIYQNVAYLWIAALIAVVVYSLNFDEKVKATLKQSFTIGALLKILIWAVSAFDSFIRWFIPTGYYEPDSFKDGMNKFLTKFLSILNDSSTIIVYVIFAFLLIRAISGKHTKISALDKVTEGKPTCPKCGSTIASGSAFCTKCGNKIG